MKSHTRRRFNQLAAVAGVSRAAMPLVHAGSAVSLRRGFFVDPCRKLRIACVGCGGKGISDIQGFAGEEVVALCDVDEVHAAKGFALYPDVPKFKDFRRMLAELDGQIDAVTVSTPDHMHHAVGMAAIQRGKHVFIQKPLAVSIREARELTLAARRHGVATAMGNQGHAQEGVRLVREWVQAGIIGDVREVHVWTEKLANGPYRSATRGSLPPEESAPSTLDWNLWLGTARHRPYSREYVPFKWRGWWGIGNGPLGDIGCHTMDAAYYALDLGSPVAVTAQTSGFNEFTFPDWSVITYEFPRRGKMPPVKLVWHDGGKLPPRPPDLEPGRELNPASGYYLLGDRGTIYDPTEKCRSPRIIPETKRRELAPLMPPKTIPRVPGGDGFREWIAACKGGPRAGSNFDYSGPLSETVLLGNLAIRANGRRMGWDTQRMLTDIPELNRFI